MKNRGTAEAFNFESRVNFGDNPGTIPLKKSHWDFVLSKLSYRKIKRWKAKKNFRTANSVLFDFGI